jgi:CheY-like chemotaxis protein
MNKILVVDDTFVSRRGTVYALLSMGFLSDEAVSGVEALELVTMNEYSLILMDYHMPIMDGIVCAKEIESLKKQCKVSPNTSVILFSAAKLDHDCEDTCLSGVLDKACSNQELHDLVVRYCYPDNSLSLR